MATWFYRSDGQEVGPADEELLATLISLRHITPETEVRKSDQEQWQRAEASPLASLFDRAAKDKPAFPSVADATTVAEPSGTAARSPEAIRGRPRSPSRNELTFFRSCVLALIVLSSAYALFLTYIAIGMLSPGCDIAGAANVEQIEPRETPGLLLFLVDGISIAVTYVGSLIIVGLEVATLCLALFVTLLYLYWIYMAAKHLEHARDPGQATRPHRALLWHLIPGPNLIYPPRLMLRLYRWAERERGVPDAKRPRALTLWWGANLLALIGALIAALFFFVPAFREDAISDALGNSATTGFSLPPLFVAILVIVFWMVPLSLSAFLWLQNRISSSLYLSEMRR